MPILIKLKDLSFNSRAVKYFNNDLFQLIVDRGENN